ncbi:MAG: hypothetical protein R3185_02555 [Candidatus Thermoplasmatota archaeon]|nr:hypothetical protein [Candidatus Thermoplasmatota archaeon]
MAQPTLLLAGGFAIASAMAFAFAGSTVVRREHEGELARANNMFALWWYALSASTALGGIQSLSAGLGVTSIGVWTYATYANLLLICAALWGLLYYLVYLFTGKSEFYTPLGGFYVVYFLWLLYYITSADPIGVDVQRWGTELIYARPLQGTLLTITLLLLLIPQIVGALAYATVYFRLREPAKRFRVVLVSASIFVWFTSSLLASLSGLNEVDWWQLVSRTIGLTAALLVILAYRPPEVLKRRWRTRAAQAP